MRPRARLDLPPGAKVLRTRLGPGCGFRPAWADDRATRIHLPGRSRGRLVIGGWLPPTLNELTRGRLRDRIRKGKAARAVLAAAVLAAAVPPAAGRRRVAVEITFPPGKRMPDVDAFFKAILDGLVEARCLVSDHYLWCEAAPVVYRRGPAAITAIELVDLEPIRP